MENRKITNILLGVLCVLLVAIIIILINTRIFSFSNKTNINDNEHKKVMDIKDDESSKTYKPIENNENKKETKQETKSDNKTNTQTNQEVKKDDQKTVSPKQEDNTNKNTKISENELVAYFQKEDSAINNKSLKESVKNGFINVVDFIFYDKEIKGYKFKELTNDAKLKIISVGLSIDKKIDSYFPNYKETIKGKYTDIKDKLVSKYLEYSYEMCDKMGETKCNQLKEDFQNLKEKFSLAGNYLKDLSISGGNKIKEWYEKFREENK